MNNIQNVDEKTFYMKEEDDEVLRQLHEIQQLQAPSSVSSSGASSSQNNNYKYSDGEVASLKAEVMGATAQMYDTGLKQEGSPQQSFSIQQQFFHRDDSPLLQSPERQQQIFAYAMSPNTEAQLPNPSALQNTITSLSCKECAFQATNWEDYQRHLMTAHITSSEDEETVMKKKKKMKTSDTSKPAHIPLPRTAYAFFVQICHDVHRRKHPDQKVEFSEFSRKCAARWKTMTPDERKRFDDMAEEDKTRYDLQIKPPQGIQQRENVSTVAPKRKKLKRDPNQPKRPLTPFFFFCAENRNAIKEKDPSRSVGDIAKILGAQWSQLTLEEKQIYEVRASADRERYEKEMTEYTANLNRGMGEAGDSPSKMSTFSGASSSPKVVVQMPQTSNSHLHPQIQTQQQHQISSPMKRERQQQQQQQRLNTSSPTLNQQQQQALLAALQHHDKLKGFSLDVSDGLSHQSTPTQSPTSAINYSITGSASPSDFVTASPQASLLDNYSDMQVRNGISSATTSRGIDTSHLQETVALVGGNVASNFLENQNNQSSSNDSNETNVRFG